MSKKGATKAQGLSLNTIVIAVIVLVVLVVLLAVFTGRIGGFNLGVDKCNTKANHNCVTSVNSPCPDGQNSAPFRCYKDADSPTLDPTKRCCVKV